MRLLMVVALLTVSTGFLRAQSARPEICSGYAGVPLPAEAAVALPQESQACESYKSYSGIGLPVSYQAARACAWQERAAWQEKLAQNPKAPLAWVVGGDAILVNLYANGLGVARNLPVAIRLACEENAGLAAEGIEDLARLVQSSERPKKRFSICDYAATTFTMNFCGGYEAEIKQQATSRELGRLSENWTDKQKALFRKLERAKDAYVAAHVHELDQSGTVHNMKDLTSQEILRHNFLLEVRRFEKGDLPGGSASTAREAERQMRQHYEKNLAAASAPVSAEGQGTAVSSVAAAQSAWEAYRTAWIAFAAARYPSVQATAFRAYFAKERAALLIPMRGQIWRQ